MALTPLERRERLRQRTHESAVDRGQRGLGKGLRLPFDLSKAVGKELVWYELTANPRELNLFDIIPWEVRSPNYALMRQFTGKPNGRIVGDWDYKLEISIHKKIGIAQSPVLCLREMFGQKCVICDDMFDEYKKRGTADFNEKVAKALQPQWRTVYVVYDYRDAKHEGFKLWDVAYKSFEEYLMTKAENDPSGLVVFSDPFDGRVIEVEGKQKKIGTFDYVEPAGLRFLPREDPYAEEDVHNNFPLDQMLIIPTLDEVTRLYLGMDIEHENEPDNEVSSSAPQGRRRSAEQNPQPPVCVANGVFGVDLFKHPECEQSCPEETFNACSKKNAELKPPEDPVHMTGNPPVETTPATPQRSGRKPPTHLPEAKAPASSATAEVASRRRR